ncbi:hypothetical protein [Silvimonas iriomotensis]|uniref:Neuromedin U n=1 Tax=Silvimonas iriomotensis TaxID=449662 RepID=A0ABQ2PA52_9NEIS|nr:hypothetical protein [Silvimonas iriomotensis]GGP22054.1 hypothetical protein GCM10010970_23220 [Silvimonas iriomotensis]
MSILSQSLRWLAFCTVAGHALASASADDANKSNNPLNPAPGLNFQDYYVPSLFDSDKHTNDFLLRGTLPVAPGLLPLPQLFRLTVPVSTRPAPDGGYSTALGDVNLFDIFLMGNKDVQLGIGPLLTMPTATHDELGTGKWQAGLAAVVVNPTPERLLGALVQWQHSFAGDNSRPNVNSATVQPFLIYNLPEGWYLRSTGIWNFNLNNGEGYIPAGFGAGKVWRDGKTVYNLYLEPQVTVWHDGAGQPHWTVLGGLNLTLGGL